MAEVTMYTAQGCNYCQRAEQLLARKGVSPVVKIRVDISPDEMQTMIARSGRRTVPQIFIGTHHVGGFDDLASLEREGRLDDLLLAPGHDTPAN